jgi:hypothetical protein
MLTTAIIFAALVAVWGRSGVIASERAGARRRLRNR